MQEMKRFVCPARDRKLSRNNSPHDNSVGIMPSGRAMCQEKCGKPKKIARTGAEVIEQDCRAVRALGQMRKEGENF